MKYEDEGLYNIAGYLDEYYNSKEGRTVEETMGLIKTEVLKCFNQHKESLTHEHLLTTKIEERNNKPVKIISGKNLLNDDKVNSPSHYTKGDIEVIDIIKQLTKGYDPFEAYLVGNTIKYLARANFKENKQQDLEKAEWHINKLLEEQNK